MITVKSQKAHVYRWKGNSNDPVVKMAILWQKKKKNNNNKIK